MFLSNLIFRFKIKRKAKREYREARSADTHITVIDYATNQERYLRVVAKYMEDTLKLLYGDLPTKEETPDFIDRLDEELRRK